MAPPTLRTTGIFWVLAAFAAGLFGGVVWCLSQGSWQSYLDRAHAAGFGIYAAMEYGAAAPKGLLVEPLTGADAAAAERGDFTGLSDVPAPPLLTYVTISGDPFGTVPASVMALAVISRDIRYPVAKLEGGEGLTPPEKLAAISELLARYCSDPLVVARNTAGHWFRLRGGPIWGCDAVPRDLRLVGGVAAGLVLAALLAGVAGTAQKFRAFAEALRSRRRLGGPDAYEPEGPAELRDMVGAVNDYLGQERERLYQRAAMLSGVSHDLGTPATRLKLRVALIADPELRGKLTHDIDRMIGMVESVLVYTRAEMNAERPRPLSLTALVEALVADHQDVGRPVEMRATPPGPVAGGSSLFMSRRGQGARPDERRMRVVARPLALQRAVDNLIENALRYGRRASVSLSAGADFATITVEDEGGPQDLAELERLIAPFQRGANAARTEGFGLGLTIVATVAGQHGGSLQFEQGERGLRARLTIRRG